LPRFHPGITFVELLYWITLPIGVLAVIVMAVILLRHWKEIRLLNPDSIAEERERQKRDELLLQRLSRVKSQKVAPFKAILNGIIFAVKTAYHAAYIRLVRLEKFYKQATAPFAMMAPSTKERVKALIDEARSLARDMKWADAERRYLEALQVDNRNVDAYKGLGIIYLKQKLYPQAKETFEFIFKSRKADDVVYAAMAEIAEAEKDYIRAEEMRMKAVELRPRLPNRHAELAEFYMDRQEITKAWPHARQAAQLDPKSSRYLELSLETAILLGDREEARRRYDKLRVLSEDRPKLNALKERIEAMGEGK
jgi:tetratricopeptide (TPR) repeat protein